MIPTLVTPRYKSDMTKKLRYGKVNYTVDFNINISNSINCSNVYCPSHKMNIIDNEESKTVEILNYDLSRDCKLYIGLKEELSSNALISQTDEDNQIIYMSFMPEIEDKVEDSEKEYIFVIDVSGSMDWDDKLDATKNAVINCLHQLDVGDKFNIIPFSHEYNVMGIESVEYNEETLNQAIEYVKDLEAIGGTEIFKPLQFALYDDNENTEYEKIVLLFTDGEVGVEEEEAILDLVENQDSKFRIFPFGIDSNVNSEFIKELAKTGRGKAEFILPGEKIDEKILRQFIRIQTPLLEDVKVDYGSAKLMDEIKEDSSLFNYEFYNVFAKIGKNSKIKNGDITLKGHIGEKEYRFCIDNIFESPVDLRKIFAKCLIDRCEEYIRKGIGDPESHKQLVVELATKYNINSKYTSFITVYERDEKLLDVPKVEHTTLSSRFACVGNVMNWMSLGSSGEDACEVFDDGVCFALDSSLYGCDCNFSSLPYYGSRFKTPAEPVKKENAFELLKEDLTELLPSLSEDERNVLRVRYCLDGGNKYKMSEEAGQILGMTKERVLELENSALGKLCVPNRREKLGEYLGRDISYRDMLGERLHIYYLKFMESEHKSLTTYLLFAILCKTFDYQTLFDYLEQHKTEIQQSELCMQLICRLFNIINNDEYGNGEKVDNLHLLPELLNQIYKKILLTNYNLNIDLEVLSPKEEKDIIENNTLVENIDRAIWTLYCAPNNDEECISEPSERVIIPGCK